MKTIIAGSRSISTYNVVEEAIKKSNFNITEIVSGTAKGVDSLGERYAYYNHIPVKYFVPEWQRFGKKAGLLRNEEMSKYADALIAVWDGFSHGTKHMIDTAIKAGLKVYIHKI